MKLKSYCYHNKAYARNIELTQEEKLEHIEDCNGDKETHPCGYKTINITYDDLTEDQKIIAREDKYGHYPCIGNPCTNTLFDSKVDQYWVLDLLPTQDEE